MKSFVSNPPNAGCSPGYHKPDCGTVGCGGCARPASPAMLTINVEAKHVSGRVGVKFFKYATNGRTAIDLVDPVTDERLVRATVNIREVRENDLQDDEVILKGWAENEGVPEALMAAGVIGPERGRVYLRFVDATIHQLLRRE